MAAPIALRLATRQWLARPLRPILCSIAIAAAVALIICVGVAMDSLRYTIVKTIGEVLGVAEVHVRPAQRETDAHVSQAVVDRIRALPEVDLAGGRLHSMAILSQGDATATAPGGTSGGNRRWFDVLGIDPATDDVLRPKKYGSGRGLGSGPGAENELVVDGIVARIFNLKVGDQVTYTQDDNPPRRLTVVGITQRPTLEIIAKPTLYIPLSELCREMKVQPEYNVVDVKLKEASGIEDFDAYAKRLQKVLGASVDVAPGTTSKARLTELTRTLQVMLLLMSVISAFCAALIIGTTLSVGVQERVRQFGQLRCIGASRGQLALFLLGDASVMLFIGEGLGLLLGLAVSALLIGWFPQFFAAYRVSWVSIAVAFSCGCFATFLGALIPIWQVTRVPPMAAVQAMANPSRSGRVWLAGAAGIFCLAVQALLWLFLPTREARFYGYVAAGVPLIFAGWCLLAPAVLVLAESVCGVALASLMGVRPGLLRHAWSRTPWRAGAMIAALMIGVTLFTTVRARGQSLLASWTSPARIPDLIVKSMWTGLSEKRLDRLRREHPEFREISLLDYFGVRMNDRVFGLANLFGQGGSGGGETTFIAVNPADFARMVELDYVQGDPATALKQLEQGRHIFVSREFYNVRKLGVGDKLTFRSADGTPVDFTIAAVVQSTGVELVKNFFDLRSSFSEKSVSSVLGNLSDAHKYFKLGEPTLMLANVDPRANSNDAMRKLQEQLTVEGMQSVSSVELKTTLRNLIENMMNGLSVVGIGALCVASLGVANMVIASVHAKRFEFGVLRAIGAGRGQLVRLVLAEVTLIGVVAGVLGTAAGLHFAFMASQVDFLLVGFPSTFLAASPRDVAVSILIFVQIGIVLTTLLAWLASLGPALRGATTAQRTLLASGRA